MSDRDEEQTPSRAMGLQAIDGARAGLSDKSGRLDDPVSRIPGGEERMVRWLLAHLGGALQISATGHVNCSPGPQFDAFIVQQ